MKHITPLLPGSESPLELLSRCGGYYNQEGTDGPLVGYAGTYDTPDGAKQYVGRVYANFAKMERHSRVLHWCAEELGRLHLPVTLSAHLASTGFCGAPEGGKALATVLAHLTRKQYIFPDSEVVELATASSRKKKKLFFDRHMPEKGESWWLTEDVVNNVSTPKSLIPLFDELGAEVLGILCFLNRGEHEVYQHTDGREFPILPVVRQRMPQYRQDNPEVADDIARGNIVWKPKDEWEKIVPYICAA